MPSTIPGFMYSLFAALIVGSIIVCSCSVVATNIKNQAVTQQLQNIDDYIATESLILLAHTTQNNQNATQYLEVPAQVGNERFWVRIANDTSGAWVESGFGASAGESLVSSTVPARTIASGSFVSGSGRVFLQCHFENQIATLTLTCE